MNPQKVTSLSCIWTVLVSNLGRGTNYSEVFRDIPQSLWSVARIVNYFKLFLGYFLPDPCHFEHEIHIAKLKRYKSPGSDQIPAELIQTGGEILRTKTHKLIQFILNKVEFA
jgi:hypothetical protein